MKKREKEKNGIREQKVVQQFQRNSPTGRKKERKQATAREKI